MVVRRIVEFATGKNWTAVLAELFVVIVGVFLGLQAQEWNQKRIDRNEAEVYIDRLIADFSIIENDLGRCLSVYRNSLEALDVVSTAVEQIALGASNRGADSPALAAALIRMTAGDISAGRSATFVEMLSTGGLGLLQDAALRDALMAYDEDSQVNREIWRSIRSEVSAYGRPLYENIVLRVDPDAMPMSSIDAYDLEAVANDPGFRAMLNVLAAAKANMYELCGTQLRKAGRVREALAAQTGN